MKKQRIIPKHSHQAGGIVDGIFNTIGSNSDLFGKLLNWDDYTSSDIKKRQKAYEDQYNLIGQQTFTGSFGELEDNYGSLNVSSAPSKWDMGYMTKGQEQNAVLGATLSGFGRGYNAGKSTSKSINNYGKKLNEKYPGAADYLSENGFSDDSWGSSVKGMAGDFLNNYGGYATAAKIGTTWLGGLLGNIWGQEYAKDRNEAAARAAAELENEREGALMRRHNNFRAAVSNADTQMDNFYQSQYAAFGGMLDTNGTNWETGATYIDNGGSHQNNPFGGVQYGIASDGLPNLVEEGEVVIKVKNNQEDTGEHSYAKGGPMYSDYVLSNRVIPTVEELTFANITDNPSKYEGQPYAQIYKDLTKGLKETVNSPITKNYLNILHTRIARAQEDTKLREQQEEFMAELKKATPEQQDIILQQMGYTNPLEETIMAAKGGYLFPWGGWTNQDELNNYYTQQYTDFWNNLQGRKGSNVNRAYLTGAQARQWVNQLSQGDEQQRALATMLKSQWGDTNTDWSNDATWEFKNKYNPNGTIVESSPYISWAGNNTAMKDALWGIKHVPQLSVDNRYQQGNYTTPTPEIILPTGPQSINRYWTYDWDTGERTPITESEYKNPREGWVVDNKLTEYGPDWESEIFADENELNDFYAQEFGKWFKIYNENRLNRGEEAVSIKDFDPLNQDFDSWYSYLKNGNLRQQILADYLNSPDKNLEDIQKADEYRDYYARKGATNIYNDFYLTNRTSNTGTTDTTDTKTSPQKGEGITNYDWILPAVSGANLIADLAGITNVADYSNANRIGSAILPPRYIGYNPNGRYVKPQLVDTNYLASRLANQSMAGINAAKDLSGSNRATALANIAAQNYLGQQATGEALAQSQITNNKAIQDAVQINNAVDRANSEGFLQAARANQAAWDNYISRYAAQKTAEAKLREDIDNQVAANRSANWNNFLENMQGYFDNQRNRTMANDSLGRIYGYNVASNGSITFNNNNNKKKFAEDYNINIKDVDKVRRRRRNGVTKFYLNGKELTRKGE